MILNNQLILRGNYQDIFEIKRELDILSSNTKKQSKLYNVNTNKYIKKLKIVDEVEKEYLYNLHLSFQYTKGNILEFIDLFQGFNVEVIHMCESEKKSVWIVTKREYIKNYRLVPEFAIHEILYEYMNYKESAVVTDQFDTIKFDRNSNKVVVNDKNLNYNELIDLLFNQTIKGKVFYDILEQFINNYHEKCINSYENLYSINKEVSSREEPSPLALFIVTFGIFGIIAAFLFYMGYL